MPSKKLAVSLGCVFLLLWCKGDAKAQWSPSTIVGMEYPKAASQAGIEGKVKIILTLSESGKATSIKAEGDPDPNLFKAIQENALKWTFTAKGPSDWLNRSAVLNYSFSLLEPCSDNPKSQFAFTHPDQAIILSTRLL